MRFALFQVTSVASVYRGAYLLLSESSSPVCLVSFSFVQAINLHFVSIRAYFGARNEVSGAGEESWVRSRR